MGLVIGAILMGAAILLTGVFKQNLLGILSGAAFLGVGAILLVRAIPMLGAPVIAISLKGFKTPLTPQIDWKLVDGIYLHKTIYRGSVVNHVLMFQISSLPQHISEFALFQRLLYRFAAKAGKERLILILRNTSEQPDVIYRLVRMLWTKSTGRDYDWNPNMSEEFNTARRKVKEATDLLQAELNPGVAPPRGPDEIVRVMKEMESNDAVLEKELRRKARQAKWVQYVLVVLVILYIFIRFSRKVG